CADAPALSPKVELALPCRSTSTLWARDLLGYRRRGYREVSRCGFGPFIEHGRLHPMIGQTLHHHRTVRERREHPGQFSERFDGLRSEISNVAIWSMGSLAAIGSQS